MGAKERHVPNERRSDGWGDIWTWGAIDQDTRLIITWLVGERDDVAAHEFIGDLGSRLANRVQITTDGYKPCLTAIEAAFGADVDYAMQDQLRATTQEPSEPVPTDPGHGGGHRGSHLDL